MYELLENELKALVLLHLIALIEFFYEIPFFKRKHTVFQWRTQGGEGETPPPPKRKKRKGKREKKKGEREKKKEKEEEK